MSTDPDSDISSSSELPSEEFPRPKLHVKTFGCQMNEYDTEKIYHLLAKTHEPVAQIENADVIILNTCSVRERGEHKLYSLLGELRERKEQQPGLVVGVSGCVAQQEGEGLLKRSGAVDFVVGTHNLSLIPSLLASSRTGTRPVAVSYREEWEELPEDFDSLPQIPIDSESDILPIRGYLTPVRAMVAIQRGCNKKCAFCVVPTTRGVEVSRDPEEVLREIRFKVRAGAREVMLLGQTVNSYGRDLSPRYPFHQLIREVAKIDQLQRIRFISPHPADVRPEFIELFGDVPQLMPQIHLPLQSGNDRILQAMNRNYRIERFLEIVESLRSRVPDIALSTDIIVGFPTETDSEFEDTLQILRSVRFESAYYYKYSVRPNTTARLDYKPSDTISPEVLDSRFQALHSLQRLISEELNQEKIGTKVEVLVEGQSKNVSSSMKGRVRHNTPIEVDGFGADAVGKLVAVKVVGATSYGLRGQAIEESAVDVMPR